MNGRESGRVVKPGTIMARLIPYFEEKVPYKKIQEETGYDIGQIRGARQRCTVREILPPLTKEEFGQFLSKIKKGKPIVASFAGHKHTDDTKRKIGDALRGKSFSEDVARERSTIWRVVKPLFDRGGSPIEIASIANLTYQQVRDAVHHKNTRSVSYRERELPPSDVKRKRKRIKVITDAHFRRFNGFADAAPELEEVYTGLAAALHERDFFREDNISNHDKLVALYDGNGREFPAEMGFAGELILETFYVARLDKAKGEEDALKTFSGILDQAPDKVVINFKPEFDFIRTHTGSAIVHTVFSSGNGFAEIGEL